MDYAVFIIAGLTLGATVAGSFVAWRQWKKARRDSVLLSLRNLRAELHQSQREYLRFCRDGSTDPNLHSSIIAKAQCIVEKIAIFDKKCPETCVSLEIPQGIDEAELGANHSRCKNCLSYIAEVWLTDNQVSAETNQVEAAVWGEYQDRNQSALSAALDRTATLISQK